MEAPAFWSDLASYLASKLGEGIGMALPALIVPFLFRWSRTLSLVSGILAGIAVPVAFIYTGRAAGSAVDHAVLLAIAGAFGAFLGAVAHSTYRRKSENKAKPTRWRSSRK